MSTDTAPRLATHGGTRSGWLPVRATDVDQRLAPWPFWAAATAILVGCVVFHSHTDPGLRYSIKQLGELNYGPDWFLAQKFGKFMPIDLAVGLFAYLALCYRWSVRRPMRFSRRAVRVGFLVSVPMVTGFLVGYANGSVNMGDSRYYIMGGIFALGLWSTILNSEEGCFRWAQIFAAVTGVYGLLQLLEYTRGGGEIAFYGRTTLADHATLEYMVAGVAVSLALSRSGRTKWLWWFTIGTGSMVVILGFRRYAWVELAIVFGFYLLLSGRRYLKSALVMALFGAVAIALLGSSLNFSGRLSSFDIFQSRSQNIYATTNQGHIDAILDGAYEVLAHPLTGAGTGVSFIGHVTGNVIGQTQNGPIDIWVKYGLIGEIVFWVLYYRLFAAVWRRRRGARYTDQLAWGVGAYLFGQFIVVCTVYSWPFDTPEKAILSFSVIAMAFPWRAADHGPRSNHADRSAPGWGEPKPLPSVEPVSGAVGPTG